ncbi:MAG: sigma-70 family RNA polymerase sigma factor [Armatimonadota bacterium]
MKNAHRPRLTEEQIQHLLERYRTRRDTRARDKLVLQYRNLVESIGRRFAGAGEPVEDLVQEGYIGLMSALDGFDASKGVKFSTYATHFVIGQIKHYLRDKGKIIKEPAWLQELNQRMQRVIESLAQQYGRAPTEAEIAQVMKISEEEVSSLLTTRDVFKVGSLDAERDDGSTTGSEIEKVRSRQYETFELPIEDRIVLESAVERLKNVEQRVIHEYFFRDLNQTEIARKLGISCNYVSHILRNSTRKLKKILTTEDLKEVQVQLRALQRRGGQVDLEEVSGITDPATGLYTRSYFLARLEEELSRATRHHYPVAVMLMSLEYLSDSHGGWVPMTADERLEALGQAIRSRVRRADLVARYEAHQFALMLPHTGSQAAAVCERLHGIVQTMNASSGQELFPVRGTLTFASFPEDAGNIADLLVRVEAGHPPSQAMERRREPLAA